MSLALTRPEIVGWFGVASSSHWLASAAAMRMLEIGGNAFDGAVAAGMALQALCPHLNGPAGDVTMLIHDASGGETLAVCGQGETPAAATIDAVRARGLQAVPGTGLLPAVIPGAFDAWMMLLAAKGTLSLSTVMEPALGYAIAGAPVDDRLNATLAASKSIFDVYWPTSAQIFMPEGAPAPVGGFLPNPVLARTWTRILDETKSAGGDRVAQIEAARRCWSDGFVAEAIDDFCRHTEVMDVSGQMNGAFLRGQDLAGWRATFEPPILLDYAGHQIAKCGPWTQGPALLQCLSLLPADEVATIDPKGADFVHYMVEALKLSFADRETFYGDDRLANVPIDRLLDPTYASARQALIGDKASNDFRPGDIPGFGAQIDFAEACRRKKEAGLLAAYGGGEPTVQEIRKAGYGATAVGDTCHLDVVDAAGNMVSATPSGGWLQSSPAIPELGFPLGTRAQMMWLDESAPSKFGPGRRPRTTLSPTLVLDGYGRASLACGTPGGDQQDQWQSAFLIRHLVHGMGMQEAIEAPAFHSEHWPNSFFPRAASPGKLVIESRFGPDVADELRRRGHDVAVAGEWTEGRLTSVSRRSDGTLRAAANPRGGLGYAIGR